VNLNIKFDNEREQEVVSLKRKIKIKLIENNLRGLRELIKKMEVAQRGILRNRYGNLLGLLDIEVPMSAITALTQYYDTPLRWFTFQNFLLIPTIEEYEQIVDLLLRGKVP